MLKTNTCFCFLCLIVLLAFQPALESNAVAGTDPVGQDGWIFHSITADSPVSTDFEQTADQVSISVEVADIEKTDVGDAATFRVRNEGIIGREGYPDLPAITRWIRVPERGIISLEYEAVNEERVDAGKPSAYSNSRTPAGAAGSTCVELEQTTGVFPLEPVTMKPPRIMRGVRLVELTYYPVRWDADRNQYLQSKGFTARIVVTSGTGINEVRAGNYNPSQGFTRLTEALTVNPPSRDNADETMLPGAYLVVYGEGAPEEIFEFVEWKRRAGHRVELLEIDGENLEPDQLKDMIEEVFADFRFEFLVFMGTDDADGALHIPLTTPYYDIFFTQLEGDDNLPDAAVGTFNCVTEDNLICAVRRAISYQSQPYYEETDWFTRAGVGVGACSVPDDLAPSYTGKWIAEVLRRWSFDDVATSFFSDNDENDPSRMVERLYNENTNFILIRAHQWDLETDNIDSGPVFPFYFLVSSGTITPPDNGAFNWAYRIGTPDEMRGPSAGFGHWASPRTNDANALAGGLIESMFLFDIGAFGWARNYAVTNMTRVMVHDGIERMEYNFSHWRYYGDPGQWCWVGVPVRIEADYSESIDPDATDFELVVTTGEDDDPVAGATACLYHEDGLQAVSITDLRGRAYFTFDRGLPDEGEVHVTVTGKNLYPHLGEIDIESSEFWIALEDFVYNDTLLGNSDGRANPGEAADLFVSIRNTRDERSPALNPVTLVSESPWLEIEELELEVEPLDPEQVIELDQAFRVHIHPACPNKALLEARLVINAGDAGITAGLSISAVAPALAFNAVVGNLNPGEETNLRVSLQNNGDLASEALNARLESMSPFVTVTIGEGRFPALMVDDVVQQEGDPFVVESNPNAVPGSIAGFRLILGNEAFSDTVFFTLPCGMALVIDPFGPDGYGYIAIDDEDTPVEWGEVPQFQWVEIHPDLDPDFEGEALNLGEGEEPDRTFLIDLPFPLRYYGEEYEQISVCTNGWIAPGDQTNLVNQQNWLLPGFDGTFGMIAVFWDRLLYNREDDGLLVYNDAENGRYIFEWMAGVEVWGDRFDNVFQAILFDPNRFPSPTGDSQILFQYLTVNNVQEYNNEANYHATVGLSSPDALDGLTYTYWNQYPEACAPVVDRRAILWTTVNFDSPASVFGRVTRWVDSTAVVGATVSTSDGLETMTSFDGYYRIFGVEPGEFNIAATAPNYGEVVIEGLEIEEGGEIRQDLVLPHVWLTFSPDTLHMFFVVLDRDEPITLEATGEGICHYSFGIEYFENGLGAEDVFFEFIPDEGELEAGESADIEVWAEPTHFIETDFYYFNLLVINDTPADTLKIPVELFIDMTHVQESSDLPTEYAVESIYPNPFNSTLRVTFAVPSPDFVSLKLYDVSGRLSGTLVQGCFKPGTHTATLDASGLPTGIYFIRLNAENHHASRRALLIK